MRLTALESDRVRRFVKNSQRLTAMRESQLSRLVSPSLKRATLNRLANSDQRWEMTQADAVIRRFSLKLGVNPDRIWDAILRPSDPSLRVEVELISGDFYALTNSHVDELARIVRVTRSKATHMVRFGRTLPWYLWDSDLSHPILGRLTRQWTTNPFPIARRLRQAVDDARERFLVHDLQDPARTIFVGVCLSGLLDMLALRPPFQKMDFDVVVSSLQSTAIDAILERSVLIAVINDLANPEAREWVAQHADLQSVDLFDDDALVVRRDNRPVWRVFRRSKDPAWSAISSHYRKILREMAVLACHPLTPEASARFILQLVDRAGGPPPRGLGFN